MIQISFYSNTEEVRLSADNEDDNKDEGEKQQDAGTLQHRIKALLAIANCLRNTKTKDVTTQDVKTLHPRLQLSPTRNLKSLLR